MTLGQNVRTYSPRQQQQEEGEGGDSKDGDVAETEEDQRRWKYSELEKKFNEKSKAEVTFQLETFNLFQTI
jgi:hypothetical protein